MIWLLPPRFAIENYVNESLPHVQTADSNDLIIRKKKLCKVHFSWFAGFIDHFYDFHQRRTKVSLQAIKSILGISNGWCQSYKLFLLYLLVSAALS